MDSLTTVSGGGPREFNSNDKRCHICGMLNLPVILCEEHAKAVQQAFVYWRIDMSTPLPPKPLETEVQDLTEGRR